MLMPDRFFATAQMGRKQVLTMDAWDFAQLMDMLVEAEQRLDKAVESLNRYHGDLQSEQELALLKQVGRIRTSMAGLQAEADWITGNVK